MHERPSRPQSRRRRRLAGTRNVSEGNLYLRQRQKKRKLTVMSSAAVQRRERPLRLGTERCRAVVDLIRGVHIMFCDGGRRVYGRSLMLRKGLGPRMRWAVWKMTATHPQPEKQTLQLETCGRKLFSTSRSNKTGLAQIISFIG